ncbi:hypothetical protein RJ639_015679, partial [Escallonia herrerae]
GNKWLITTLCIRTWKEHRPSETTSRENSGTYLPNHLLSNPLLSRQPRTKIPSPKTNPGSTKIPKKSLKISKMTKIWTTITSSCSTEEAGRDKGNAKIARFGSVIPISGSDFVREVSQAPPDVWVVVILYKDGYAECGLLLQCLEELATKYPATKFVKIISTDCIPNYQDCNLPTLLVYNNGAVKANHVRLHPFGRRCTPEGVELVLCQSDPVLNDGQSGKAVLEGVGKRFIEKVVTEHEDDDDGSASD